MEEKSIVELKALINYVALVENINWAKRRLEVQYLSIVERLHSLTIL